MNKLSSVNSYIKNVSVNLTSYSCVFTDVETKKIRRLNFYEKAIVEMLSKGVNADTIDELIVKISKFLSIKEVFVDEFIRLLQEQVSLHDGGNVFSLSSSAVFTPDKKDSRVLTSNVQDSRADFSFSYISQLDVCTAPTIPGLIIDDKDPVLISENYLPPLISLITPHNKKLEEIAQDTLVDDLAMPFDKDFIVNELSQNQSFARPATFNVDIEYSFDEFKRQGTLVKVKELLNFLPSPKLEYFANAITNYVTETLAIDYEEPLYIKAKKALEIFESSQQILISHKKDYLTNEKQIEDLNAKIKTLENDINASEKVLSVRGKMLTLIKTDDNDVLSDEQSSQDSMQQEIDYKKSTLETLRESIKQIETENIIITHKIEDVAKAIINPYCTPEFADILGYLKKIQSLYLDIMQVPYMKVRQLVDAITRDIILLLAQIEDRCEEGIKETFKRLKNISNLLLILVNQESKSEEPILLNDLCDDIKGEDIFRKLRKKHSKITFKVQDNLIKFLYLLNAFKPQSPEQKADFESIKKSRNKDFFEDNINNKTYRKDIIFAIIEFINAIDYKSDDWRLVEEKIK